MTDTRRLALMTCCSLALLVPAAHARDMHIEVPFPTAPIYPDKDQRICLGVNVDLGVDHTEAEAGGFRVTCEPQEGRTQACLTVLEPERGWPTRVPRLVCRGNEDKLVMKPVPAFDPTEDPWDGVVIARNVDLVRAVFRVPGAEDAYGVLDPEGYGQCGIEDGYLWMVVPGAPRRQACLLDVEDGRAVVPIRLVKRLDTSSESAATREAESAPAED